MMYGKLPQNGRELDHINGAKDDNRIENLRLITHSENSVNTRRKRNNTSGHAGVFWNKQINKWVASIRVHPKRINLGNFDTKEEAVAARKTAEEKYYPGIKRAA